MKSHSFLWGCVSGVGGGATLCVIGLLLYISVANNDSQSRSRSDSSQPTSSVQQPTDMSSLQELLEKTNLPNHKLTLTINLQTASFNQILELFNQTVSEPSNYHNKYSQETLIELMVSRNPLATLNAMWFLSYSLRLELLPFFYSKWASEDPEEALKSAAQQSNQMRRLAVRSVVSNMQVPVTKEILELSNSLDIEGLVNEVLAEVSAKELMQSSPQEAFELVFSDNIEDVQQEALLLEIIETWMRTPDEDNFAQLFSSFHDEYVKIDLTNSQSNIIFINLVEQIVQVDPHKFWRLNLSTESEMQGSLNSLILRAWARLDPPAALSAISEIEGSEHYDESYRSVWRMWTEVDPMYVLQNIQQVQPEQRETVIGLSVLNLVRQDNVEQAIASIVQMKDLGENIRSAVRHLTREWIKYDATAATDWLVTTDTIKDALRKRMLNVVLPVLSKTDPMKAYRLAVEFGDPEAFDPRFTLEMTVLDAIAKRGDFEGAKELLQEVEESLLPTAYSTIGLSFISFGKIDDAIALGARLSEEDQPQYFQNLTIVWFQLRPDELFANLTNLPSVESQQAIARILIDERFGYQEEMSEDEITMLENLVPMSEAP